MPPSKNGQSPMIEQRTFGNGIMDQDSDLRAIAPNNYIKLFAGTNNIVTDRGTVCNVPSNVEISFQMFNGENKIIGAIEDLKDSSIIFYNYNSFGYHGIYRWFRNKQGYVNGLIEQVKIVRDPTVYNPYHPNPLNFQKTSENRITGAWQVDNLNFFTDYFNRSKFIALLRANESGKRREFNLYFNRASFTVNTQYTITLWQGGNAVSLGQWQYTSIGTTAKAQTADFIAFYQLATGTTPMSSFFGVNSCDNNYPKITMNSEGEFYVQVVAVNLTTGLPINQPVVVANNFYPDYNAAVPSYDPLSDDLLDRLCYTEIKMPTAAYNTDVSRETNFVRNKVYQFRTTYKYFENSYSVYSAISTIPIPQNQCNPNNFGNTGNVIRINFTDERLQNPSLVSIIDSVEIAMLEPALGATWVTIKRLDPFEFAGVGMQYYDFYNDQTTEPIDVKKTDKPFESLFIKHKSDEYVDDRGFAGGGIESYDKPCVDADIFIDYLPPTEIQGRYKITGNLGIQNVWYDGDGFPAFQQQFVWKYNGGATQWGGIGDQFLPGVTLGTPDNYQQRTPTGGFVVYLAGTNYFAIAKHPNFNVSNLTQDTDGVFLVTPTNLQTVNVFLQSFQTLQQIIPLEFTIPNVPPGKYILRIASHLTDASELGVQGYAYQKSSTNVGMYNGLGVLVDVHEQEIEITNADFTAQDMIVLDLCDPTNDGSAVMGYIVGEDAAGDPAPTTVAEFLSQVRIDLGKVRVEATSDGSFYTPNRIADHNGYVWAINETIGDDINFTLILSSIYSASPASSINIITGTSPFPDVGNGQGGIGVWRTTDTDIRDNARTTIKGTLTNCATGEPLSGLTVVNTRGGWTSSDNINGSYSIIAYAPVDTVITPRSDKIIFSSSGSICQFSFAPDDEIPYTITISLAVYNNTTPFFLIPSVCANIVALQQSVSKWKRGSDRFFGIVYGDEGDRKCAVAVIDQQVHITFYTELDSSVSPAVIRPRGAADIRININNEPPDWATKYWIVASLNQQHSSHLVWMANRVTYVDADDQPTTIQLALRVKINLDNIGFYTDKQNPEAIINYTFVKGDRIRFILDENNNYYPIYLDYEVIKATATDIYIEVDQSVKYKEGCVFELYTPRGKDQTRIFYEIGHCGLVKDAVINGVLKKYHEGNYGISPDQTYGTFPLAINKPANIKLGWGDVYYRTRNTPYGYDPSTSPPIPPTFKIINITDDSISDFYSSKANGWGRPNTDAIEQGQTDRRSTMRFSNRYISGTLTNGLRNFEALNEKQFSTEYGLITKLILIDATVLKTLFSNSFCVSNYINQGVLRTATGAALISISDDVISNTHLMQRRFGTMNPESVVLNDEGDLFWWDENLGVVAKSSGNALDPISDQLMNSAFTDISGARNKLGRNNSEAPATYDKNRDLYILSFDSMQPKAEVKSSVVIEAFDCDPATTDSIYIRLTIKPLNVILISATINSDPDFPDISKIIVKYVNAYGNGWSASVNEYGNAVIYSPDGTSIYYNQAAVLTYVTSGASETTKDFNYTFVNGAPAGTGTPYAGETVVYCKSKKGWTEYHPYVPECYGMLRTEYVSFLNGKLWLHGDISQYNNFYGVQYARKLTVPFNKDWSKIKILTHLEVNTNSPVYSPNIDIPANAQNPIGMNTELTKQHFKVVHGKYWADMTKDKLTPDELMRSLPLTVDNKWVNGRVMTGQVMTVELCNDTNELAPLIEAQLGFIFSEKS